LAIAFFPIGCLPSNASDGKVAVACPKKGKVTFISGRADRLDKAITNSLGIPLSHSFYIADKMV